MRLHRLEIEGFGPFRARQTVDFDAFADDGVFLIGGRTGAGKSSILDAVCFGLYGSTPRFEGGEKRLRSDHCEPGDSTEVVVEFSTTAGRFRVTRSPDYERPAKRGGGMTTQAAAVALEEQVDGAWIGRAARAVDVGNELDTILQLNMQQFLQVILLAQNRFARFLLADSRERQSLLRKLFGTERFEDYQARFDARRRMSEQELGLRTATVAARIEEAERLVAAHALGPADATDEPVADAPPAQEHGTAERIDDLRRAETRSAYRTERAAAERDDAETALGAADALLAERREQRAAQTERDRARAALAGLDAEAPLIAEVRNALDRARAADVLRPALLGAQRAADALAAAESAVAEAASVWEAQRSALDAEGAPGRDADADALRAWAAERTRESGAWEQAAELEAASEERLAAVETARADEERAAQELTALAEERAALPSRLEAAVAEHDALARGADRVADLTTARERAETRLSAAAEGERLAAESRAAEAAAVARETDAATAFSAAAEIRRRRLSGYAGELAAALVPGEPCSVCGSTVHPSPAEHADPVTAEDSAAAEERSQDAAEAARTAVAAAAAIGSALAAALARADGRTVADAEAELAAADGALAQALAAVDERDRSAEALRVLRERAESLTVAHDDASARRAVAGEALAVARQRSDEAEARIASARGNHPSVAARLAALGARIAAAEGLARAIDERIRLASAADDARAERERLLDASPFATPEEASAALLTAAEQELAEERITAHRAQREKERGILLDLEMRMLPDEPLDLVPVEEAAAAARAAWTAAVSAASLASTVATQLSALVGGAAAEHDRSAAQAEEHETLRALADTLAGRGGNTLRMNLETFVLAAELEEIVEAANLRLSDMSSGRYRLRHSDARAARGAASGLGIVVFDAFTGQTRPAQSLSGGETFLGSLALALGLAEVVTARAGGIRLDTLFIDEGFGSLDAETLEVAMRTLDELRQGGRTVGVISHVEAMQEQIPAQITVRTTPDGPSVIEA